MQARRNHSNRLRRAKANNDWSYFQVARSPGALGNCSGKRLAGPIIGLIDDTGGWSDRLTHLFRLWPDMGGWVTQDHGALDRADRIGRSGSKQAAPQNRHTFAFRSRAIYTGPRHHRRWIYCFDLWSSCVALDPIPADQDRDGRHSARGFSIVDCVWHFAGGISPHVLPLFRVICERNGRCS